ncbi:MAG: hypothetical protein HUU50_22095 [Candidatus Brocadiae bacterium]|nr:hypothetical protein [Candidatus Brocadiia bacterium]
MKFFVAFLCFFLLSCADIRYQSAKNWMYDQQYEEACYFLESLLKDSPDNQEYKSLLEIAKNNAGQAFLEKIRQYAGHDLETAQHFYNKAKLRIEGNPELARWEERLKIAKADVDTGVAVAQNWMNQNQWDEALLHLEKLQNYKGSYPYLENLKKTALQGSFYFHFLQGLGHFENRQYDKAYQSFSICLEKKIENEIAQSWQQASQTHITCHQDLKEGQDFLKIREYSKAFIAFMRSQEKFLTLNPLQREPFLLEKIEESIANSRQKETQQIYEKAIQEESRQTYLGHFDAIRLYRTCLSKITPFLDCQERIEKNKKKLATLFQREGEKWLQYPGLRYIGIANRFFEEAYSYDPSLENLTRQKEHSESLCLLKLKNTIKIQILGGEESHKNFLQENIADSINQKKYPFVVASSGDARESLEQYKEKLLELGYSSREDIFFPIYQLNLEILISFAQKTGENSYMNRLGQYYSHRISIPSWEFVQNTIDAQYHEDEKDKLFRLSVSLDEQARNRYQFMVDKRSIRDQHKESLSRITGIAINLASQKDQISSQIQSIQSKVEENRRYIARSESEMHEYQKKLKEVLTPEQARYYKDKISELSKKIASFQQYNSHEAPSRLRGLRSQMNRVEKELDLAKIEERKQQGLYYESETKFEQAQTSHSQAQSLQNRMQEEQETANREWQKLQYKPPQEKHLEIKTAYQYRYSPYQIFGTVWIKGYMLDIKQEKRLLALESKAEDAWEEKNFRDIHIKDCNSLKTKESTLPTPDTFEKRLQMRSLQELQTKLESFFASHHLRYWQKAQDASSRKNLSEMAENLSLFIKAPSPESQKAAQKLQEMLYLPIE